MKRLWILFGIALIALSAIVLYRTQEPLSETATFGGVSLKIEYALTPDAREQGLGGRTILPEEYGMLFVFPKADYYGFWMRDTLVPLDIFWLDETGRVVSMSLSVATSSYPNVFYPTVPALYVLETSAGFGRANHIATSTSLMLKKFPTVSQ